MSGQAAVFAALIDYAGLFPPAALPMQEALSEYRRFKDGEDGWIVGRFVAPISRLAEIREPFSLSAVGSIEDLNGMDRRVESLEIRVASTDSVRSINAPDGMPCYVELPWFQFETSQTKSACEVLAKRGMFAKIRCGGATLSAIPSSGQLAFFLSAARDAGVSFKATAGLHHPIRNRDHGFINLITAAALSAQTAVIELEEILDDSRAEDFVFEKHALRWRDRTIDSTQLSAMREFFHSFGSCSIAEPLDGLKDLGLVA